MTCEVVQLFPGGGASVGIIVGAGVGESTDVAVGADAVKRRVGVNRRVG